MSRGPWIVAHRGQPGAAENTLAGFRWALEIGADMVECDVRRSADGGLLTHHDPDFRGKPIQEWTFAELQDHKPIPSFEAVLQLVQDRCLMDVELKETGYEATVLELTKRYLNPDQFIVTSFQPTSLHAIRGLDPEVRTGLLIPEPSDLGDQWIRARQLCLQCQQLGASILAPHWQHLHPTLFQLAQVSQISLLPWTVNDPDHGRSLLQHSKVLGVITDIPERLIASMRGFSEGVQQG
ncbi:MAG: glycerophosphodiester phosphodiesterase [Synechococcaceae cyanobacterium SM2_3_1]|nr:glycerophosphodiester phosphodiesterase [Synechococcaceae cyanobacterium SM2_3_1]